TFAVESETRSKFQNRARLSRNRAGRSTCAASKKRQRPVAHLQTCARKCPRRTRDQTESETIRHALARNGRQEVAKDALRNSVEKFRNRDRHLWWEKQRPRRG